MLYGFSQPSSIYYYYRHYSFYYRADENGVKLPKIHLILCRPSSATKELQTNSTGASSAKGDEIEKCWQFVYDLYTKHRDVFEVHSLERVASLLRLSSNSIDHHQSSTTVNNHIGSCAPPAAETFDEFMRQYVMHISHEINTISRIAVKSHSPLLAVKHPHQPHEHQSTAQTFDKTLNEIVERI